jgi:hypothetical protein
MFFRFTVEGSAYSEAVSSRCLQEIAIGPYPGRDKSSEHGHTLIA